MAAATSGAEGTPLEAGTDYTLTPSGNGFVITFSTASMHTGSATLSNNKLEGMYITVKFTGTLDPNNEIKENTTDLAAKTYSDLTAADVTAMVTTAKTLRASNNTRYKDKGDTVQGLTSSGDVTAALALANSVLSLSGSDALTDVSKIDDTTAAAIQLALEKLQRPGAENTATITYANHYATSDGEAKKDSKVYHHNVDLRLDKIADTLILEGSYNETSNDYTKNENASEQAVVGAVFELLKVDQSTGSAGDGTTDKSLGYCASKADKHLYPLKKVTTEPASGTWSYRPDANQSVWYVFETGPAESKKGWDDLTVGEYRLKEIQAPTGYKPFDTFTFVITADTTGGEYNGIFSAGTFTPSTQGKNINDILVDNAGNAGGLTFVNNVAADGAGDDNDTNNGELKGEVIDPPVDTLPATGGIGTVLFTAGGIAVVLAAGALFVMYMKKRETEE